MLFSSQNHWFSFEKAQIPMPVDLAKSGVIQIYRFSQGAWRPIGDPINGGQAEAYAWSTGLSADGGVLAVGARYYDGDAGENSGRVVA